MKPLTALAQQCSKVDKRYLVSLRHGAHTGDTFGWHVTIDLPGAGYYVASGVFNPEDVPEMERICSDMGTHIQQRFPSAFGYIHEESPISLDIFTEKSRGDALPGRPGTLS